MAEKEENDSLSYKEQFTFNSLIIAGVMKRELSLLINAITKEQK